MGRKAIKGRSVGNFFHTFVQNRTRKEGHIQEDQILSAIMDDVVSGLGVFFLMSCFNKLMYEDLENWFVYSGSSHHVTGLREISLSAT